MKPRSLLEYHRQVSRETIFLEQAGIFGLLFLLMSCVCGTINGVSTLRALLASRGFGHFSVLCPRIEADVVRVPDTHTHGIPMAIRPRSFDGRDLKGSNRCDRSHGFMDRRRKSGAKSVGVG